MRIKSPFKDYYDSVQAMGQDQGLVYIRTPKVVESDAFCQESWQFFDINFTGHHVGFCGKFYRILEMRVGYDLETKSKFFTTFEAVDAEVRKTVKKKELRVWDGTDRKYVNSWIRWSRRATKGNINSFFNPQYPINSVHLFDDNDAPIIVSGPRGRGGKESYYTVNGSLRAISFAKIKDPYTAYQELMMWMSNRAAPFKPIPEMSNDVKIASKGFDAHSFRQPKKKK